MEKFNEDYYLRGPQTGVSNYKNYRWMPELTIPMASYLKNLLNIQEKDSLLDYGCARGYFVKALRSLGIYAYGTDISHWAIENCDPEVKDCVFLTEKHLDIYDYIFCKDVLEHIDTFTLNKVLPLIFDSTMKAAMFIVPLTNIENGPYLYPDDEMDKTHIQRRTLDGWIELFEEHLEPNMVILSSKNIPALKPCVKKFPGSAGYFIVKKAK